MTDQQLAHRLLDLAIDCEIAGRDMTAQALRDAALEVMTVSNPELMRNVRNIVDLLVRK